MGSIVICPPAVRERDWWRIWILSHDWVFSEKRRKEKKDTMEHWSLLSFLTLENDMKGHGVCALEQIPGGVSV